MGRAQQWRRQWQPTPVLLPGKSHRRRNLVGCSPWGREESDTTEQLPFHFSLSCIGEGNGNPPQCSCLENPRDSGAWWAAVYGVAQSQTRLKELSSSSSRAQQMLGSSWQGKSESVLDDTESFQLYSLGIRILWMILSMSNFMLFLWLLCGKLSGKGDGSRLEAERENWGW